MNNEFVRCLWATSEYSSETAHPHSIDKAFKILKGNNSQISVITGLSKLHARFQREDRGSGPP